MGLLPRASMLAVIALIGCRSAAAKSPAAPPPAYGPYPPGIAPADLDSETQRVRREVQGLFEQALAEANSLPPPVVTGQPPREQGSGYRAIQTLGKLMNYDENMSPFRNVSCASCHMPYAAFGGPIPSVNLTMIAYPGTYHFRAGKRTAQRYAYSPWFPVLQYDATAGAFFGGNFWDSRATGYRLQNPDAEQAQGPPVDTQEMGFPDAGCIAFRLAQSRYRNLFERVWGVGSLDIAFPPGVEHNAGADKPFAWILVDRAPVGEEVASGVDVRANMGRHLDLGDGDVHGAARVGNGSPRRIERGGVVPRAVGHAREKRLGQRHTSTGHDGLSRARSCTARRNA